MNIIHSCIILCISIFFNVLSVSAMENKDNPHLFETNNGRLMEWIIFEEASRKTSPFPQSQINQDYRSHPDFQYFKSRFEKDFNSREPLDEIQFQIGSCYYSGTGVAYNLSHAAWWYHKSAIQENQFSLRMLNVLAKNDKNEDAMLYLNLLQNQISFGTDNWESC